MSVRLWFDAPSLTAGAELAALVVGDDVEVDVRHDGVCVRAPSPDPVLAAAADLGLAAGAASDGALQHLAVVVETARPDALASWWSQVLGGPPADGDPPVAFVASDEPRPLRDRWHLDVVRPGDVVAAVGLGAGGPPYGVRHADPDGNEVDLVPGDPFEAAADWCGVFSTMACYRVGTVDLQRSLVGAVADLADRAGFPLLIGTRPGWVVLDTGKDRADPDAHGLDLDVGTLAAELQRAAHDLGAVADTTAPRFVQLVLDAADVDAARAFWAAALGYVPDRREGLTDLVDPRRLGPVVVFQPLDPTETDRRRQRNRIHLELALPADAVAARVRAAVDAGGTVTGESAGRTTLLDPEGNELVIVAR